MLSKEQAIARLKEMIAGCTADFPGYGTGWVIDKNDAPVLEMALRSLATPGRDVLERAVLLLETFAETGMLARYEAGNLTENAVLCKQTAAAIRLSINAAGQELPAVRQQQPSSESTGSHGGRDAASDESAQQPVPAAPSTRSETYVRCLKPIADLCENCETVCKYAPRSESDGGEVSAPNRTGGNDQSSQGTPEN